LSIRCRQGAIASIQTSAILERALLSFRSRENEDRRLDWEAKNAKSRENSGWCTRVHVNTRRREGVQKANWRSTAKMAIVSDQHDDENKDESNEGKRRAEKHVGEVHKDESAHRRVTEMKALKHRERKKRGCRAVATCRSRWSAHFSTPPSRTSFNRSAYNGHEQKKQQEENTHNNNTHTPTKTQTEQDLEQEKRTGWNGGLPSTCNRRASSKSWFLFFFYRRCTRNASWQERFVTRGC
jgi:hypothetical protein